MFETMLNKAGTAVYQPRSIADWLNRAPGGGGSGSNYGYFGPASSMLSKDITAANPSGAFVGANFFTDTYGAKVWDALNSQTRVYNLIRKVPWGNTTGYRIRSGRNTSTTAVTEVGALPDIAKSTLQQVNLRPVFIVTSLGVSALAQFLGTLEGGIGDALAVQQETAMVDHIKRVNQMLAASSSPVTAVASAPSAARPMAPAPSMMHFLDSSKSVLLSARWPINKLIAPSKIDFPAPVSPVMTLKPVERSRSIESMSA